MRFTKLYLIIIAIALFITGCNSIRTDDTASTEPYPNDIADSEIATGENTYWAKDNLDLQRVGNLLEKADDAEEFEYLLNSEDGINNLDLNGDGYVDYISVAEFEDYDDNQRGFTLFDRFGPNEIQEIASIIFNRNGFNDRGARILLRGNEQIYGNDHFYETNWLDRALPIISYVFGNRDNRYESPYYYENYPDYYEPYPVVETPVYRTRVVEYYPEPVFVKVDDPTITEIKIKSKYKDKSIDKIYARLAKPTREQIQFKEKNPNYPEFVPVRKGFEKRGKELRKERKEFEKRERKAEKEFEKQERKIDKQFEKREKKFEKQIEKQNKQYEKQIEKQNKQFEKQNKKFEKQNVKFDRPKNEGKKGGGNGKGKGKGKD